MSVAIPPEVEAEAKEMQAALGQAISAWARVEGTLCGLFEFAVAGRGGNTAPANHAFCAVRGAEIQIAMTSAALVAALSGQAAEIAHWEELAKRTDKLRERRNKLAHGQITTTNIGRGWSVDFMPFHHVASVRPPEETEHWTAADINRLTDAFRALAMDLFQLHFALLERQAPAPLSPAPDLQLGRAPAQKRLLAGRSRPRSRRAPVTSPTPPKA